LRDSKVAKDLSEVGNLGRGQGSRHNLGLGGGEGDALLTLARVREGAPAKQRQYPDVEWAPTAHSDSFLAACTLVVLSCPGRNVCQLPAV